jgi:hypothetical protein
MTEELAPQPSHRTPEPIAQQEAYDDAAFFLFQHPDPAVRKAFDAVFEWHHATLKFTNRLAQVEPLLCNPTKDMLITRTEQRMRRWTWQEQKQSSPSPAVQVTP